MIGLPVIIGVLSLLPVGETANIGLQILEIENQIAPNQLEAVKLEEVVTAAKGELSCPDGTRDGAMAFLTSVGKFLSKQKFVFVKDGEEITTLTEALRLDQLDCDTGSFLYLAIADELELPLLLIQAPRHALVRWLGRDFKLNWEVAGNFPISDEYLIDQLHIDSGSIERGIYLRALGRQELLDVARINTAIVLLESESGREKEVKELAELVTRNSPQQITAPYLLGICSLLDNQYLLAEYWYDRAIAMDPALFNLVSVATTDANEK